MKIPLTKPLLPPTERIAYYFDHAREPYRFTNNSGLFWDAAVKLSRVVGADSLPVTSGTTALEVALHSLGLKRGSTVAIPDFTHVATLNAVVRAGHKPILVGVSPSTWTMDPDFIEGCLLASPKVSEIDAAVVVSPFGYHVDTDRWDGLAKRTGLPLVYDFAGGFNNYPYYGTPHPVCYSFHATKNFSIGEGGAVCFSNKHQFDDALARINFHSKDGQLLDEHGFNGKIDELRAAVLLAALEDDHMERVAERTEVKRALIHLYQKVISGAFVPPGQKWPSQVVIGNLRDDLIRSGAAVGEFEVRRYYDVLTRVDSLAHIDRLSESPASLDHCWALPSDVNLAQAFQIAETLMQSQL